MQLCYSCDWVFLEATPAFVSIYYLNLYLPGHNVVSVIFIPLAYLILSIFDPGVNLRFTSICKYNRSPHIFRILAARFEAPRFMM